ncbi:MAG: 1-deoxy-D-xylulose-5-phosphate reductoisomerase [Dehalococcoidales bacterium]|jgi:1-deoxy-D-xylulose-5-phosphate reductoisomerase|nr:1-deoxy-D-xylulose-5-phosphate reductoisomerase [Dehalococcoidales bacterium]
MASIKQIALIGSTGSIGRQTLEIVRSFPERFRIIALAAGKNTVLLEEQVREFHPKYVYFQGHKHDINGSNYLSLEEMLTLPEIDTVLMAPAGITGLKPTLWAAKAGKKIALANKESLVMAGDIITSAIRKSKGRILPVDSEHSAIWQCLKGERKAIARLILTASGGPFAKYTKEQLARVTPEQALRHPSWLMGPKVTIDSATLLNKGLEIIEAHHLFGVSYNKIKVLVHPPSVVHSMVEFKDGSIKAQLSYPDMRFPIQYALTYPERWTNPKLPRLDWKSIESLPFTKPNTDLFPCLELARSAGVHGGTYPAVLCGAGEAAVAMFLSKSIPFLRIASIIEQVLNEHRPIYNPDINTIEEEADRAYKRANVIGME